MSSQANISTMQRILKYSEGNGYADFFFKYLNTEDMKFIAEYIISNKALSLKNINLNGNLIGDKGGELIVSALLISKYCKLKSLTFSSTGVKMNTIKVLNRYLRSPSSSQLILLDLTGALGDPEIKELCSALIYNTTLTSLYLIDGDIREQGATWIEYVMTNFNSSLSTVDLSRNNIDQRKCSRIDSIGEINSKYIQFLELLEGELECVPISETMDSYTHERIPLLLKQMLFPLPSRPNNHNRSSSSHERITNLIACLVNNNIVCRNYINYTVPEFKWKFSFLRIIILQSSS